MTEYGELTDFEVFVPDAALADLRRRLRHTRWPDQLDHTTWEYGTDGAYLHELCEYWAEEFDWRKAEAGLNTWPQVVTTIDGQRIHAIHARSRHPGAIPLLLTHGWPGSVVEFLEVIGPLVDPPAHGRDAQDAFHVVCPSLPGFGWSGPTRERGWHIERVARAFDVLMSRLGYDRYAAQGGDWGALLSARLGVLVPERLIGIHLNMTLVTAPRDPDLSSLTAPERAKLATMREVVRGDRGFVWLQGTKPQTLSYALADSPVGQCAWIVEKFRAWSDCGGDVESAFSRDALLANISTYWFTATAGSSARLYYESQLAGVAGTPADFVSVPSGFAVYPKEMVQLPRAWVEAAYNVHYWSTPDRGGHFAAMEQPALFAADVQSFFRPLRRTA